MERILIENGIVVTQNDDREIIHDGAVAIEDDTIAAVGPTDEVAGAVDADRVVDASDHLVIPGLINAHTHVTDILLRGSCGTDRGLYDWLYNVKQPGTSVMTPDDHETAAALYCWEAIRSGITTFVENDAEMRYGATEMLESKFRAFERSGIRSIYARGVRDLPPDEGFEALIETITAKEPTVDHPDQHEYTAETDEWVAEVESLIDDYHGSADGRHEVWIAPVVIEAMTTEGLQESYRLAEEHDVMTTIHTAEAPEQEAGAISSIEKLSNIGCLGEHALLGHCVQVTDRDLRLLAKTDTRVAHNVGSNMALGNGFAPIPSMRDRGVTVGVGTDNSILSDQVNMLGDLRLAALAHKGHHRDPGVLPAQEVFDMATIEAARSIRKEDTLGSLEVGKRADVALLDVDHPQFTPLPDVIRALVYQARGTEFDTVICDGSFVMEDGEVSLTEEYPDLRQQAIDAASRIVEESGLAESDHS
ncbi:amidohydrolase family protein [Natrarchaeobius chitinivorans]|uniref:Amidohydrolase n=1 Tax=Natrarchaeobius chitinivorans TaxID=1679083 RepID=A0A3N6M046_NATCH|nr:amidohydrolase [Natrarchaeobius chitinivorans]RQG94907.1 amidohydrolase [Natrarchaeobius chitinivorans]